MSNFLHDNVRLDEWVQGQLALDYGATHVNAKSTALGPLSSVLIWSGLITCITRDRSLQILGPSRAHR
eukprot:CAMPEP_0113637028 /NCGR_PEP_ID=MMETSP0017_2-20120614/19362_1 /TAXON_ID=2856 /ORGANISM="Cylindrotheca closterium" /LENGTH=67 /DNA_ID=CAMNT_0000547997 /DNA_START=691 /DNA_END=894 /DNA_ORIENTATION=+ /assembly_acc=CAM_ASM_000147